MSSISHDQQHNLSPREMERDTRAHTAHDGIKPSEIAVGVIVGRASEYFDYFVYGIASVLVFPQVFFPFELRLEGTLWAFVIFALAFIARPIGTVIFMSIQKRFGRGIKLTGALFLLGVSDSRHRLPARLRGHRSLVDRRAVGLALLPGPGARRLLGRPAFAARAERAGKATRLVRDGAAVGRTDRFPDRCLAVPVPAFEPVARRFH